VNIRTPTRFKVCRLNNIQAQSGPFIRRTPKINMGGGKMTLADHNAAWKKFLESEKCPPVLGLAPLSSEEAAQIRSLVHAQLPIQPHYRLSKLIVLLKQYPAVMSVWLAWVAGDAYAKKQEERDTKNFWLNFSQGVGVEFGTQLARAELVTTFRQCCFVVANVVPDPPELGSRIYVDRLLFQAGLPLCHVGNFARSMHWVEQQFSLPDPDAPDAGQDLRALMARSPYLANLPILKKALAGPAGPLICEVALRVALDAEPLEINPALSHAIAETFQDVTHRRAERPHAPFLRLAADFNSLEVVCPKQPASLVGPAGLTWFVGGTLQRVGANDETVFPVSSEGHFTVELRGLAGGHNLRREFDLRWAELKQPFLVFDAATRCWRRVEDGEVIALRSGQYWVLHSVASEFDAPRRRWDWPDGQSAFSEITLHPGCELRLAANEKSFVFKAAQVPFFVPTGKTVCTDELERLHYGWDHLPEVWCPVEDDMDACADWKLRIVSGGQELVVPLTDGERDGRMMRHKPPCRGFLELLKPGLHTVELSVSRGSRRSQCREVFKLWMGLCGHREGVGFECSSLPTNIRWEHSAGFRRDGNALLHANDNCRRHVLAFEVGDGIETFCFSRCGTFLESFEKRSGHAIHPEARCLGDSFSASIQSARFLRIWRIPTDDYQLLVNGQVVQEVTRSSGRLFSDLGLANLATQFPSGGEVAFNLHGSVIKVARFTKPLVPRFADTQSNDDYESLVFKFADQVSWVRPKLRELVSGRVVEFEGQCFSSSGHCTFTSEALPRLECANVSGDITTAGELHRVSLDVPKQGWPAGSIWLMELEIRRDENSAWQLLSDELGGGFPIVLAIPPTAAPSGLKAVAYWWAFSHGLTGGLFPNALSLTVEIETSLCELLSEVSSLLSRGYNGKAWQRLKVLERLFFELGRAAARRLEYSEVIVRDLIQTAGREVVSNPARSLFVTIPELFTLSAEYYTGMPDTDELRDALRWCARTRSHSRVAEGFMDAMEQVIANPVGALPGIFGALRNFANSAAVMQTPVNGQPVADFKHFNFRNYRSKVVRPIRDNDLAQAEWIEVSPFDRLCRNHALRATHALRERRQSKDGQNANEANTVFANAGELRSWLQTRLGRQASFVSQATWMSPWLDVDLAEDALATNLNCYASMAALAARAPAAGWMRYSEFLTWQTGRFGIEYSIKATTTLVAMSPELYGFYLLLWELLIRTQPHD
jgi:hypothetical protein